jgi:hypothetical protein
MVENKKKVTIMLDRLDAITVLRIVEALIIDKHLFHNIHEAMVKALNE